MEQIDWSDAPEGATHYNPHDISTPWRMLGTDDFGWWWNGGTWLPVLGKFAPLTYIAKPSPWTGEGLPPVGAVCEVLWNESRMEYLRTKVFGVNEHGQPIHRFDEGPKKYEYQADVLVTPLGTRVFRPLRTPEQIAAEAREKAIEEMWSVYWKPEAPTTKEALGLLYDAGYRKL
jgi:hypothetical protein